MRAAVERCSVSVLRAISGANASARTSRCAESTRARAPSRHDCASAPVACGPKESRAHGSASTRGPARRQHRLPLRRQARRPHLALSCRSSRGRAIASWLEQRARPAPRIPLAARNARRSPATRRVALRRMPNEFESTASRSPSQRTTRSRASRTIGRPEHTSASSDGTRTDCPQHKQMASAPQHPAHAQGRTHRLPCARAAPLLASTARSPRVSRRNAALVRPGPRVTRSRTPTGARGNRDCRRQAARADTRSCRAPRRG